MRDFVDYGPTNVIKVAFNRPAATMGSWSKNRERFLGFCSRANLPRKIATEIWSSIPLAERGTKEALIEAYFLAGELSVRRNRLNGPVTV